MDVHRCPVCMEPLIKADPARPTRMMCRTRSCFVELYDTQRREPPVRVLRPMLYGLSVRDQREWREVLASTPEARP